MHPLSSLTGSTGRFERGIERGELLTCEGKLLGDSLGLLVLASCLAVSAHLFDGSDAPAGEGYRHANWLRFHCLGLQGPCNPISHRTPHITNQSVRQLIGHLKCLASTEIDATIAQQTGAPLRIEEFRVEIVPLQISRQPISSNLSQVQPP